LLTGENRRKASVQDYVTLAATTTGGMYFTNWSLNYLNYATRVMFKSSKVVPVMAVSIIMQGTRYSLPEYASVILLTVGICLFTMGDMETLPKFDPIGIFLIMLGVLCDAVTANFEERRFFKELGCSHLEVVFYSNIFASMWALMTLVSTGEAGVALTFSMANPSVFGYSIASAAMGYVSVSFVLLLIKNFGATFTEVVKSTRKVLTIGLSFMLYAKPVSTNHQVGGVVFTAAVAMGAYVKSQKAKAKGAASSTNA